MTVLEALATTTSPIVMELMATRDTADSSPVESKWDNQPTWDNWPNTPGPWDNRPTWDNWNNKK